jgi:hypothetical protein
MLSLGRNQRSWRGPIDGRPFHLAARSLLASIALFTAMFVGVSPAQAATISVDCNADSSALQPAIDAAEPGSTLLVSGRCIGSFVIDKDLTLAAASKRGAKLLSRSQTEPTLDVLSSEVSVQGLRVTNSRNLQSFPIPDFGVENHGTLTLERSAVNHNPLGGIHNFGSLALLRSTVKANGGFEDCGGTGGILSEEASTLAIRDSMVAFNNGGGIINYGTAFVERSTINDNNGCSFSSVGITTFGPAMTIIDSTVTGNFIHDDEDEDQIGGSNLVIARSTIVGEIAADGVLVASILDGSCDGSLGSGGYNIVADVEPFASFDEGCDFHSLPSDLVGDSQGAGVIDPLLGPLGKQGGPSATIALLSGSPAIDRIPVGAVSGAGLWELCPASGSTDQRGVPRPQGPACDVGAYELKL